MLVDYDFEERLHQRIALREAAAGLSPRQRRLLHRYYRLGETYSEIGRREGISGNRVSQIITQSFGRLREQARRIPEPQAVKPQQVTRNTPPVGFDKAAFLKHMRGLIKRRDKERAEAEERERRREIAAKERAWQLEVAAMDRFLELATPKPPPRPPQQRYEPPPQESQWHYYPPTPRVSQYQLTVCAFDVVGELARQWPITGVRQRGWVGHQTSIVKFHPFHSIKDAIARMLSTVPSGAVFSTVALPIQRGMRGAVAETEHFAVRVLISDDDQVLRFDVTWDHPPTD